MFSGFHGIAMKHAPLENYTPDLSRILDEIDRLKSRERVALEMNRKNIRQEPKVETIRSRGEKKQILSAFVPGSLRGYGVIRKKRTICHPVRQPYRLMSISERYIWFSAIPWSDTNCSFERDIRTKPTSTVLRENAKIK